MFVIEIGVTQFLTFWVWQNLNHIWMLSGTPQAADAIFWSWRKPADGTRECAIHTRTARYCFHIPTLLNDLLEQQFCQTYFANFNQALRTTDILWTKPSELVFYTALGLPVIIAPPLGAHEHFNAKWLVQMGTGLPQEDPRYTNEWLFDWLNKGILAEAAWEGFMEAPKLGVYNIEDVVFRKGKK